jgi:hypothetical protein
MVIRKQLQETGFDNFFDDKINQEVMKIRFETQLSECLQ